VPLAILLLSGERKKIRLSFSTSVVNVYVMLAP
jgi:hypothetical protein